MRIREMFLVKWFRHNVLGLKKYKPEKTHGYQIVQELKKKYDYILETYHEDLNIPFENKYNVFIRSIRSMAITSNALEKKQREWRPKGYKLNFYEVLMNNKEGNENKNSAWRRRACEILEDINSKIIEKDKGIFSGFHKEYREKLKEALQEIHTELQIEKPLSEYDNGIKEIIDKHLKDIEIGNRTYGANLYKLNRFMKDKHYEPRIIKFSEIQVKVESLVDLKVLSQKLL